MLRRLLNAKLSAAWNRWAAFTKAEAKLAASRARARRSGRRVVKQLLNAKLSAAWGAWRRNAQELARLEEERLRVEATGRRVVRRLLNKRLGHAWRQWMVGARLVVTNEKARRTMLRVSTSWRQVVPAPAPSLHTPSLPASFPYFLR